MRFRKPLKITSRLSSITNSFVQAIIPDITPSDAEVDEILSVLGMDRNTRSCVYCGASATDWDHLRPLVRQRKPTGYLNEARNIVPSCGPCNQSKSGADWLKWMEGSARGSPKIKGVSHHIAGEDTWRDNGCYRHWIDRHAGGHTRGGIQRCHAGRTQAGIEGGKLMGFYLRKSISVGPLRFNLSKSGVGVSAGIKGLRIGAGPRGNYVHMGRGGLYYRKTLSSQPGTPSMPPPDALVAQPDMEAIESGSVAQMTDSSATELLEELNGKHKKWSLWKIVAAGGAVVVFITNFNVWVILAAITVIALTYWYDQLRKTTVLFYDFEPEVEARYQALHDGFEKLKSCNRAWHISAKGDVDDPKYHAGAGTLVERKAVIFSKGLPSYVKSNIEVPVFPAGKQALYFFPERILVYESGKVGAVAYADLELEAVQTQFIESESLPSDAKVVDRTWRYTNKIGGPDRRFKDNRELPIALYERLMFTSQTGLREYFDVSALDMSGDFAAAIKKLTA